MNGYLLARLREPSTWRGLVMLLAAAGVPLAPEMASVVISVGMALAGLIGVATPDAPRAPSAE